MSFLSFHFHPHILAGIEALGYTRPTPIQLLAIPPILQSRDVVGLAQTGTGKTAAFVLPIMQRLMQQSSRALRALILTPTRELAEQIHTVIGDLGRQTSLRSLTIYGGVGMPAQIQKLRRGVDIAVACPGRLLDHMGQGTIDLSRLEVLVLDEADRLFDMGFLPDIHRIVRQLPVRRQTLLFSATMPGAIQELAQDILRDPVLVQVDHTVPLSTITHAVYPVASHLKTALLTAFFRQTSPVSGLVFTRTKHQATRLACHLETAGYRVTALHGDLSQSQRQAALDGFRRGAFEIMVATELAARGLDVWHISHVLNYDMPETVEAYVHRIGRTGRAARTGEALTLVTPEDTAMVQAIESTLGVTLEERTLPGFDYTLPGPRSGQRPGRPPRAARGMFAPRFPAQTSVQLAPSSWANPLDPIPVLPLPETPERRPQRPQAKRWRPGATERRRW